VPKVHVDAELMMKCDMCYDRTSIGLRPMCATVCPSQALTYAPPETVARQRKSLPVRDFRFGNEHVQTKVFLMMPKVHPVLDIDVEDYMRKEPDEQTDRWLIDETVLS
jgi:Fe-S-cluster-containing dehydrogenase component